MKISVILAHPNNESFNHAIAATTVKTLKQNGHKIVFHDLYKENFNPILPSEEILKNTSLPSEIEKHCIEISEAEGIISFIQTGGGSPRQF